MRLFIAADIGEVIRERIEDIKNEIRKTEADIKFVEKENLHFTLKFLGEVDEDKVIEVVNIISECVKGVKQFKVNMEGIGFFGSPNFIRAIWIDIKDGRNEMVNVIKILNKNMDYIRKEEHKPAAHLTIGRVKSARSREQLLKKLGELKDVKAGETVVKAVVLKQSQLTKKGPIYSDYKVFGLE